MEDIAANLATIKRRVATAADEAGRPQPTLVAVSKTFGAAEILPALEAGHRIFGENRVQEAKAKWPALRERYPDLELHLIGPLQTNKAKEAVALFDVIQTIDRERIAEAVAAEMAKQNRRPRLLVEINVGLENQKAGVPPDAAVAFIAKCRASYGLEIAGLMCVPPLELPPAPYFALTAKLAAEAGLADISMGMSADFEMATAFGATMVRVGRAIFGRRPAMAASE